MDRYLLNSTVSWGAIIAGGFVAAAVTLIVAAFGVGAGLAVVSPWSGEGISATTASWAAGLFLVVIAMLASTIGGYITGRLRHGWEDVHEDERFFRDTAHGFVTWAFATVMTASVLAAAGTHIIAGASAGAIPAAAAGASQVASSTGDVYVDRRLRSGTPAGGQTGTSPVDQSATRAELLRLIAPVTRRGGDVTTDDRAYAARLIASRTGIPQAEAEQRSARCGRQGASRSDAVLNLGCDCSSGGRPVGQSCRGGRWQIAKFALVRRESRCRFENR